MKATQNINTNKGTRKRKRGEKESSDEEIIEEILSDEEVSIIVESLEEVTLVYEPSDEEGQTSPHEVGEALPPLAVSPILEAKGKEKEESEELSFSLSESAAIKKKIDAFLKERSIDRNAAKKMLRKIIPAKDGNGYEIIAKGKNPEETRQKIEDFQKTLAENKISVFEAQSYLTPFADPTYDGTFKMIFARDKDLLISLLNSLLGLTGDNEITDVSINNPELKAGGSNDIQGQVDVLCDTLEPSHKKIAVEMQRQFKKYFLARVQEYMAKMLSTQVRSGESEKYHESLKDTCVITIAKENLFTGDSELKLKENQERYELTVVPTIKEDMEEMPGNKMSWKFFTLSKFAKTNKAAIIDKESDMKLQWLDFLSKCGHAEEIPEGLSDIIRKGYEIMKVANWTEAQRIQHFTQKREEYYRKREREEDIQKVRKEGIEQGLEQGLQQGIKKGIIDKLKTLVVLDMAPQVISEHTGFSLEQINELLNDREHIVDNASMMYDLNMRVANEADAIALVGDTGGSSSSSHLGEVAIIE